MVSIVRWLLAGFYVWMLVQLEPPLRFLALGVGIAVAALWAARWTADRWRSAARRRHLSVHTTASARDAGTVLEAISQAQKDALRPWLLRRWSTGVTGLGVRDAWAGRHVGLGGFCTVFELQTTPGSSGIDVPVWRQRHGAWLWESDAPATPDTQGVSVVFRQGLWERLDARLGSGIHRMPDGRTLCSIGDWSVCAAEPESAHALFQSLRAACGWPANADLFMAQSPSSVLVVWRAHPWTAQDMATLLEPKTVGSQGFVGHGGETRGQNAP